MKLSLTELIHRLIYLLITISFTVIFFLLLESLQSNADRITVFAAGIIGFIILGIYDIRKFGAKWW